MTIKIVTKKYMRRTDVNVFIFRRDLRIQDNLALNSLIDKCIQNNMKLIPIFIFNEKQIDSSKNSYYSKKCCEFMIECLKELNVILNNNLCFFYGSDIEVLLKILPYFQIDTIAYNTDYTPFAKKRDSILNDFCLTNKINLITEEDYTLFPMNFVLTNNETPYEIFTPFYNKFLTMVKDIENPKYIKNINDYIYTDLSKIKHMFVKDISKFYENISSFNEIKGGRENALHIFNKIKQGHFNKYPIFNKTTKLSAYMKFGCISVRETYEIVKNKYGKMHELTRQLIWREFFANIMFNNPRMLEGKAFKDKYDKIKWSNLNIDEWKNGKTGFPIVDAAMRQLKKEGFIDNRLRMIIASFAIKDLHIDWRICEKYYATQAIDYDPVNNNCGWQGTANVGTDTTPYFRVINPWIQSVKFDTDAKYIKTWIPELNNIEPKHIHEWYDYYDKYKIYYKPIIDHKKEIKKLSKIYNVV